MFLCREIQNSWFYADQVGVLNVQRYINVLRQCFPETTIRFVDIANKIKFNNLIFTANQIQNTRQICLRLLWGAVFSKLAHFILSTDWNYFQKQDNKKNGQTLAVLSIKKKLLNHEKWKIFVGKKYSR